MCNSLVRLILRCLRRPKGKMVAGVLTRLRRRVLAYESYESRELLAIDFSLIEDINPQQSSSPTLSTNVNGILYFVATDGSTGRELWRSDGSSAGTYRVKDILRGPGSASISGLTNVNGTLYFAAMASTGVELWKSDGTEHGTQVAADIGPGFSSSLPTSLTNVNGTLYFAAHGAEGRELWKYVGNTAQLVREIRPGAAFGSEPANFVEVGGKLFFTADDGVNGVELWTSDGTFEGTKMVRNINPTGSSSPSNLTNVNGKLYFAASSPTNGRELWRSDGTSAGTVMVRDIRPGTAGSNPTSLTNINGQLYFAANNGIKGVEVWKTDPLGLSASMVADVKVGSSQSNPSNFVELNGYVFFTANDGIAGNELWRTDGTAAGTGLFKDIRTGALGSEPSSMVNIFDRLYFRADNGQSGIELWSSDGTTSGTTLAKDFFVGSSNGDPSFITLLDQKIFVSATTEILGNELYVYDMTAGTAGNDAFTLMYPDSDGGKIVVTRSTNGGPAVVLGRFPLTAPLKIDGHGGVDTVRIEGTSKNDVFIANSQGFLVNGSVLILNSFESSTVVGGAGNDLYQFDATVGTYTLDESPTLATGGSDTISFANLAVSVSLDLRKTTSQLINSVTTLSVQLNSGVAFENAIGSSGNDLLRGNSLVNILDGQAGNDRLEGLGGNDVLQGRAGNDTLNGQSGNDQLIGGTDDDVYLFDAVTDSADSDSDSVVENPDEGVDSLDFRNLTTEVTFYLGTTGPQIVHLNRTLTLSHGQSIENIIGGSGNDNLTGNELNNTLHGRGGDDTLSGYKGNDNYVFEQPNSPEADVIFEAALHGVDTINLAAVTSDIELSLGVSTVQSIHNNRTLRLSNVRGLEIAIGGTGNDSITGNRGHNVLVGGGGKDTLFGHDGNDVLIGGVGQDSLRGGSGDDILIAGYTLHDNVIATLVAIRNEWSLEAAFETRVARLRPILAAQTSVFDDGGALDTLTGDDDRDWYFRALSDLVTDLGSELTETLL